MSSAVVYVGGTAISMIMLFWVGRRLLAECHSERGYRAQTRRMKESAADRCGQALREADQSRARLELRRQADQPADFTVRAPTPAPPPPPPSPSPSAIRWIYQRKPKILS